MATFRTSQLERMPLVLSVMVPALVPSPHQHPGAFLLMVLPHIDLDFCKCSRSVQRAFVASFHRR
jgi:hypothetical protein